jgi:hypothetical protein
MSTPSVPNATDAIPLPTSGCKWTHVEFQITHTGGTDDPRNVTVLLTWDSDGKEIIAGPSDAITVTETTSSNGVYIGAFDLGIVPTYPAITTAPSSTTKERGTVYLFIKCDRVNTTTLKIARLHWHSLSKG